MTTFFKSTSIFILSFFCFFMQTHLTAQTYDTPGTHSLTVAESGTITVDAIGGDGGNSWNDNRRGGTGTTISATFDVTAGDVLTIFVGDQGENGQIDARSGGGGGGGSAVILNGTEVLVAAAGGGGGSRFHPGGGGLANTNSAAGAGTTSSQTFNGSGGGGFNATAGDTGGNCFAEGGKAGTLTAIGAASLGYSQASCNPSGGDGGMGFGGGGASNGQGGGGGGGYQGGDGSFDHVTNGSLGGDSFVSPNGTVVSATPGMTGGSETEANRIAGSVVIGAPVPPPTPVPTMGEWALIILALIMMSMGVITVMRWESVRGLQTAGGNAQLSMNTGNSLPFNKKSYFQILPIVWLSLAVVFAVSVIGFGYEMTGADVPGSLMAGAVGTYLIHLIRKK